MAQCYYVILVDHRDGDQENRALAFEMKQTNMMMVGVIQSEAVGQ